MTDDMGICIVWIGISDGRLDFVLDGCMYSIVLALSLEFSFPDIKLLLDHKPLRLFSLLLHYSHSSSI
jgi:hypothetical protein